MRARTIREGSVGLLILLGIGLFGGLVLWLRGFNPTNRPYQVTVEFDDTMGVQPGTPVLYRGVPVGRVTDLNPRANAVDVEVEITQRDLRIPSEVLIETVESGLIGEISIEMTPQTALAGSANDMNPVGPDCDSGVILCDGDRLIGVTGPSYEALLRSASDVAELLADPELVVQLKAVLENASQTAAETGTLAREATALTREARAQIGPLTASAQTAIESATVVAGQVGVAAQQFSLTAADLDSLIDENRGVLIGTLGNLQAASLQLRGAADVLGPRFQNGELVDNLEVLVSNASAASEDLQTITSSLNNPANLLLLQQTLESARDALASAQKVMADVDEITGDPAVRAQLRNLITGLGALVSSTQTLEQETEIAQMLDPLRTQVQVAAQPDSTQPISAADRPILVFDGERYILKPADRLAEQPSRSHQDAAAGASPGVKPSAGLTIRDLTHVPGDD